MRTHSRPLLLEDRVTNYIQGEVLRARSAFNRSDAPATPEMEELLVEEERVIPEHNRVVEQSYKEAAGNVIAISSQNLQRLSTSTQVVATNERLATIACVIPAYNEEDSIERSIESILSQTRPPEKIFVIVNNSSDDTALVAGRLAGVHKIQVRDQIYTTIVEVHDIGKNADKKVGALNYGWYLAQGNDFFLGVDGDTYLDRKCIEWLEKEMVGDTRIGGLSAIYSVDHTDAKSLMGKFLLLGQRSQFAGFNMDNLVRNRSMAVLGGQCSLFRMDALNQVAVTFKQATPWVSDSEVEDSYLSLQLKDKSVGYQTKISARARAYVGGMETINSLHNQQVKWTHGAVELIRENPFHPNLRLRWRENLSMIFNIFSRVLFILLIAAALSIGAFVINLVWLIPPLVAIALNVRSALSMHDRTKGDILFALLGVPAEAYMMLRIHHFITSWYRSLAKIEKDNWALQAASESGKGSFNFVFPLLVIGVVGFIIADGWGRLSLASQSLLLGIGWPALGVIAATLTLFMLKRLFRKQKSFKV